MYINMRKECMVFIYLDEHCNGWYMYGLGNVERELLIYLWCMIVIYYYM